MQSIDPEALIQTIQERLAKINKLSAWERRTSAWAQELLAEVAATRDELQRAHDLIALQQRLLGVDTPDPPPAQLVDAIRAGDSSFAQVTVEIDGVEWDIIVTGEPHPPDPVREAGVWKRLRAALQQARDGDDQI